MSNLLWAYASLGWAPAHLLASLAMETLRQLPFFKFQVSHSPFCLLCHLGVNGHVTLLASVKLAVGLSASIWFAKGVYHDSCEVGPCQLVS